MILVEE